MVITCWQCRFNNTSTKTRAVLHLHCDYLKGPAEKGDNVFDNLKRSKVNKEFLLPSKTTRLNFNSTQFQLLNFSLENLFDDENC